MRALVKGLAGEHTVLLSTHILSEVALACHKVLVIDRGRLVDFDTLEGLIAKHQPGRAVTLDDLAFLEDIYAKLLAPVARSATGPLPIEGQP
ncbi:MAG: hypothetical protein QM704_10890 [Anaeromyxobacteraceae bacterium]